MASVLSPINLIVILAILFVAVDCDHHEEKKYDLTSGHHFGSISSGRDAPNFFEKISHHIVKGWHGLRGLFGRKSKRLHEGYGHEHGGGYKQEEVHKPYEKEVTVNKEFPEPEANKEYSGFGQPRPSAYKVVEKEKHGHKESGHKEGEETHPEGNQGYQVGVDESFKGDGKTDQKEEKNSGYEESPVSNSDQRTGSKKRRAHNKRSVDGSIMSGPQKDEGSYGSGTEDSGPPLFGSGTEDPEPPSFEPDGEDSSSSGGDESGSDEHDESRRFKRSARGRGGGFRPRPHFRGFHGRPFRRH